MTCSGVVAAGMPWAEISCTWLLMMSNACGPLDRARALVGACCCRGCAGSSGSGWPATLGIERCTILVMRSTGHRSTALAEWPRTNHSGVRRKGKHVARRGRKARDLHETAQPPTSIESCDSATESEDMEV